MNDLETKIILEIIIYLILNIDKNIDSMKDIAEYMVPIKKILEKKEQSSARQSIR